MKENLKIVAILLVAAVIWIIFLGTPIYVIATNSSPKYLLIWAAAIVICWIVDGIDMYKHKNWMRENVDTGKYFKEKREMREI